MIWQRIDGGPRLGRRRFPSKTLKHGYQSSYGVTLALPHLVPLHPTPTQKKRLKRQIKFNQNKSPKATTASSRLTAADDDMSAKKAQRCGKYSRCTIVESIQICHLNAVAAIVPTHPKATARYSHVSPECKTGATRFYFIFSSSLQLVHPSVRLSVLSPSNSKRPVRQPACRPTTSRPGS